MSPRRCVAVSVAVLAFGWAHAAVTFDDAWIRAARPGSVVAAAYCSITNGGTDPVTIVEFAGAWRAEIHETVQESGVSRMRPLKRLTVAPGATVTLAPGGKHLMLFDLDPAASRTTLHAVFDDGKRLPVEFEIRARK